MRSSSCRTPLDAPQTMPQTFRTLLLYTRTLGSAPHNHRTAHTLPTHTLLNLYLLFRKVAISATPPTPLAR
jgi:hypothetical protein